MSPVEGRADPAAVQHGVEEPAIGAEAAEVSGAGGTTNVRRLQVASHPPTKSVVELLEGWLESAKAGEYNSVMLVSTDWEGCVTDGYAMAKGVAKYPFIGGVHCALQKFIDKHIE